MNQKIDEMSSKSSLNKINICINCKWSCCKTEKTQDIKYYSYYCFLSIRSFVTGKIDDFIDLTIDTFDINTFKFVSKENTCYYCRNKRDNHFYCGQNGDYFHPKENKNIKKHDNKKHL